MDIQQIALDVFENKESYKNMDFIVIMNILQEEYNNQNGITSSSLQSKENQCELENCCNNHYEDGLCWDCWNLREVEEESNYLFLSDDEDDSIHFLS